MQFRDLGAQYRALKTEIDEQIAQVVTSSRFILGPQVEQLEQELAAYTGRKHCVSCANGTDALILTLMAWGIGKGDAVFAPAFTFFASASCAAVRGATPVLVDIDPRTFNMCPASLEKAIEKTLAEGKLTPKVVIPVDLFGQPADLPKICEIAQRYGLKVLEDGAQGFGGEINGKRACSFGDASTTSFFPAKPLGCYGDGGAIFTDDDALDETLRSTRAQGRSPEDKYDNRAIGLNSRLDTLQAGILLPKLHAFEAHEVDDVNRVAERYTQQLDGLVVTPLVAEGFRSSWAQYTILLPTQEKRDGLQKFLKEQGIPSMIYYPRALHMQSAMKGAGYRQGDFPAAERAAQICLSLPMHPYMTDMDIDAVCAAIRSYLA